jgi:hypothetical protein
VTPPVPVVPPVAVVVRPPVPVPVVPPVPDEPPFPVAGAPPKPVAASSTGEAGPDWEHCPASSAAAPKVQS